MRTMNSLALVGRILYALPLIGFGLGHLLAGAEMGGMVPAWVPGGGTFWIYCTGVALIAGSLAIITGVMGRLAALLVAALLLLFVLTLHLPGWLEGGPNAIMSRMSLYKDLAMAGGALVIAATFGARSPVRS